MEEKLRISSKSKLTVMISFICESIKHLIWRLQSNWQQSNTKQTHLEKEVSTKLLKFKCPILVKPNHTSKDAPCVLGTVEKQPSEMTQHRFQLHPLKFTSWAFCLWTELCAPRILSFFQPQQCRLLFQNGRKFLASFTPSSNGLNISTKHTCISICC